MLRKLTKWIALAILAFVLLTALPVAAMRWVDPPTSSFMLRAAASAKEPGYRTRYQWVDMERISPHVAVWLAAQRSGDGPMFPNISATTGGNIFGVPVVLAPEAQSKIILIDASALAVAARIRGDSGRPDHSPSREPFSLFQLHALDVDGCDGVC